MKNVMTATLSGIEWTVGVSAGFPPSPLQATTMGIVTVNSPLCDVCHFSAGGPFSTLDTYMRPTEQTHKVGVTYLEGGTGRVRVGCLGHKNVLPILVQLSARTLLHRADRKAVLLSASSREPDVPILQIHSFTSQLLSPVCCCETQTVPLTTCRDLLYSWDNNFHCSLSLHSQQLMPVCEMFNEGLWHHWIMYDIRVAEGSEQDSDSSAQVSRVYPRKDLRGSKMWQPSFSRSKSTPGVPHPDQSKVDRRRQKQNQGLDWNMGV